MDSEWREVRLGDFLRRRAEQPAIEADAVYSRLTMAINGKGVRLRDRVRGRDLGTARYRARSGDLMISKIDARKGAVAVLPAELDGVIVTGDFLPFIVSREVADPAFLDLVVRTQDFARRCDLISGGTTNRVRLDVKRLPDLTLVLPSLEVQRRIVDLMDSIDALIANLQTEAHAADRQLAALRRSHFVELPLRPLGDVVRVARAGGTPSRKNPALFGGGIPWLKSGEVANSRIDRTEETLTEEGLRVSSAWLAPAGAVVVAMYGATAAQVGYLVKEMTTNQAVLALVVDPHRALPRYLYHWLGFSSARLKEAASGAAQPNLSKEVVLREAGFPAAELSEQRSWADLFDSAESVMDRLHVEARATSVLRTQLLSALLSRAVELPEAYDRLVDEGVA